tara:strand:- start:440 stop:748 length:309 start_codon:yes stop_codon:yes gene_type:complete
MSDNNFETQILKEDLKEQKKIGTGYFEAACTLSILLFIGMAVVLAMTLNDLDKCEKKPSASCPYFTSPQTLNTGKSGVTSAYQTQVKLPTGGQFPLDPFVYK